MSALACLVGFGCSGAGGAEAGSADASGVDEAPSDLEASRAAVTSAAENEPAPSTEVASRGQALTPAAPECPDIGLDASQVYYVCDCQGGADASCKPGDDANDGSAAAPFRSYARAQQAFTGMSAGQTVAFCRGGSFTVDGDRRWVNNQCKAGQPCVVRDYVPPGGSNALAKPILTAASGDAFALDDSNGANHEEGYTFLNLDVRSTSQGKSGNGFFVYNDVDDVNLCGTDVSGFDIGVHAAGSNTPEADSDGKNARLVVSNAVVKDNGSQGVLAGCDGCGVQHSKFENNGFNDPVLDHNIYFGPRGADGMFAIDNDLYRAANIGGQCRGVSLVVHGRASNLLIEGNNVHEDLGKASDGCWGIAVDTGYGEEEGFQNVTIRNNTVTNVGNVSIGLNSCKDCTIENNVITHEQPIQGALIAVADRERDTNDQAMSGVTVRNNTLYAKSSAPVTGVQTSLDGTSISVNNNALLSEGSGAFTCFDHGLPAANYASRDNNLCHAPAATWEAQSGTLEAFRAAFSAETSSTEENPQFTSTTEHNFTPLPGSPLLAKGIGAAVQP